MPDIFDQIGSQPAAQSVARSGDIFDHISGTPSVSGIGGQIGQSPSIPVTAPAQPLDTSRGGAFVRGAKSSTGSMLGATLMGAVGSLGGPLTAVPLALAGSYVGGAVQNQLYPPTQADMDQSAYDEANHKGFRIAGELAPALATARPTLGATLSNKVVGATLGAGIPAAMQAAQGQPLDLSRILSGGVAGATLEPNGIGRYLENKAYRTENTAQEGAAGKLYDSTTNVPQALTNLDSADRINLGNVSLTSGKVSADPGLMRLERGVFTGMDKQGVLAGQDSANSRAISGNIDSTLSAPFGPTVDNPGNPIAKIQAGKQAAADAKTTTAKAAESKASVNLQNDQSALAQNAPTTQKANASIAASPKIQAQQQAAKADVNAAYAKVDPALTADFSGTHEAALAALQSAGDNEAVPALISQIAKSRAPKTAEGVDGAPNTTEPHTAPFFQMQSDLRAVNDALGQARASGAANDARMLGMVKDGIVSDIAKLGSNDTALGEANAKYATDYAPLYKQGASADVLRGGKGGADSAVPVSQTIDRYMSNPDDAGRLSKILKGSPDGLSAVRDWFVSDLAASAGKNPTAKGVDSWISKNAAKLQAFPDVLSEVQQTRNKLLNGSNTLSQLQTDLATKTATADQTAKDFQATPGAKFVGAEPTDAVSKIMNGDNVVKNMQTALAQAAEDKTGAATEGVKNGVKDWLNQQIRRTGAVNDTSNETGAPEMADLKTSLAKMNSLMLEGTDSRRALEGVFSPDEMKSLDLARKQIAVMSRGGDAARGGSDTAMNTAAGSNANLNAFEWLSHMGWAGKAAAGVGKAASRVWNGDVKGRYGQVMVQAMSDPATAAQLLRRGDPGAIQKTLGSLADTVTAYKNVTGSTPLPAGVKEVPRVNPQPAPKPDESKEQKDADLQALIESSMGKN